MRNGSMRSAVDDLTWLMMVAHTYIRDSASAPWCASNGADRRIMNQTASDYGLQAPQWRNSRCSFLSNSVVTTSWEGDIAPGNVAVAFTPGDPMMFSARLILGIHYVLYSISVVLP